MATAQMQRAKQAQTTVNAAQSATLVHNLLNTTFGSIAYMRNLFHENCFEKHNVNGMDLRTLRRGVSTDVDTLLDWLEKGVFDAVAKGYLKTAIIGIFDNPDRQTDFLESYTFRFAYSPDGRPQFVAESGSKRFMQTRTRSEIGKETMGMLRNLIMLVNTMATLPSPVFLTMRLFYYDHTPDDYEPPVFKPSPDELAQVHFDGEPVRINVGDVTSSYHEVRMCVHTLMDKLKDDDDVALFDENGNEVEPSDKENVRVYLDEEGNGSQEPNVGKKRRSYNAMESIPGERPSPVKKPRNAHALSDDKQQEEYYHDENTQELIGHLRNGCSIEYVKPILKESNKKVKMVSPGMGTKHKDFTSPPATQPLHLVHPHLTAPPVTPIEILSSDERAFEDVVVVDQPEAEVQHAVLNEEEAEVPIEDKGLDHCGSFDFGLDDAECFDEEGNAAGAHYVEEHEEDYREELYPHVAVDADEVAQYENYDEAEVVEEYYVAPQPMATESFIFETQAHAGMRLEDTQPLFMGFKVSPSSPVANVPVAQEVLEADVHVVEDSSVIEHAAVHESSTGFAKAIIFDPRVTEAEFFTGNIDCPCAANTLSTDPVISCVECGNYGHLYCYGYSPTGELPEHCKHHFCLSCMRKRNYVTIDDDELCTIVCTRRILRLVMSDGYWKSNRHLQTITGFSLEMIKLVQNKLFTDGLLMDVNAAVQKGKKRKSKTKRYEVVVADNQMKQILDAYFLPTAIFATGCDGGIQNAVELHAEEGYLAEKIVPMQHLHQKPDSIYGTTNSRLIAKCSLPERNIRVEPVQDRNYK